MLDFVYIPYLSIRSRNGTQPDYLIFFSIVLIMEVECIYEKGVLRPLRRIRLKEGEKVDVKIERKRTLDNFFGILRGESVDIDNEVDEMMEARV